MLLFGILWVAFGLVLWTETALHGETRTNKGWLYGYQGYIAGALHVALGIFALLGGRYRDPLKFLEQLGYRRTKPSSGWIKKSGLVQASIYRNETASKLDGLQPDRFYLILESPTLPENSLAPLEALFDRMERHADYVILYTKRSLAKAHELEAFFWEVDAALDDFFKAGHSN